MSASYLDFLFLEDEKWEEFLTSYLSNIEEAIEQRREKIDDKAINEVIELLVEAGIERERLDDKYRVKLIKFFVKESRWLTVKAIVGVVIDFSVKDRQEVFKKIAQV